MQRPSLSAPRLLAALGLSQGVGSGNSGGFDLTAAAAAAMGDSEADAQQRRLLATVMSLQPFLRDLAPSAGSAAAAAAAAQPLADAELQRERQSVAALEAQCQQLLAGMPTSAETDEALLAGAEPLGVRRRQAVAARLEHKRLLLAAAGALLRYAAALG
jgi:hypothetical protein